MIASPKNRRTLHAMLGKSRSRSPERFAPGTVSQVVTADGRRISNESLDQLEQLDDTVFAALAGDAKALDAAAQAWHAAHQTVDATLLNETRQHYLDRARSRWQQSQQRPDEKLTVGFAALEVLDLLAA